MIFFCPSKLKYCLVESRRLQTFFFVFSQHPKWFVYDGKSIKRYGLLFSFSPPGAKREKKERKKLSLLKSQRIRRRSVSAFSHILIHFP